jgi:precorrin-2 methylase
MKGPSSIPHIIKTIKKRGLSASLVSNCGMENELLIESVEEMDAGKEFGYYSLIIAGNEEA